MGLSLHAVEKAFREEDLEGYLEFGAPADEYRSEAEEIYSALRLLSPDEMTLENIIAVISLVWSRSFGISLQEMALRLSGIERIASILLDADKA